MACRKRTALRRQFNEILHHMPNRLVWGLSWIPSSIIRGLLSASLAPSLATVPEFQLLIRRQLNPGWMMLGLKTLSAQVWEEPLCD